VSAAPPVSIGLPVYNGERYLAEAVEALLGQSFVDFELVIGDNGSTDATAEIIADARMRDPRVRWLPSPENRGAAWNYNRVFHATSGRYFRWAAYDDLMRPTYLERLVEALDTAPADVVLAQTGTILIDDEGAEVGVWDDAFDLSTGDPARRLSRLVRHLVMSNVFFGLVPRVAMERTRLHGAYPSADYVFLAELALLGRFVTVPERLFLRRVHRCMSRYANTTLAEVAEWFEPGSGGAARPETLRLFAEHLRAIGRAPIGPVARMWTTGAFLPVWLRRHKGAMAREAWAAVPRRQPPA
jgi:glycosyltransferase involved in cell wall biosynthesis